MISQNYQYHGFIQVSPTCNNWNSPILCPNCFLVCAYSNEISTQACIIPTGPAARINRSKSNPDIKTYTPLFNSPKMFCAGTYNRKK